MSLGIILVTSMASCGCSTTTGSGKKGEYPTNNYPWTSGSLGTGAQLEIAKITRKLAIKEIRSPNILVFNENPFLTIGQKIDLRNTSTILSPQGITPNLVATGAAVSTAAGWEVTTSGSWSGGAWIAPVSQGGSLFCDTTATAPTAVEAAVCGSPLDLSKSTGYVFTRPLNSPPIVGPVNVVNGESTISIKAGTQFSPRSGDQIELAQTALTGANAATVRAVTTTTTATGNVRTIILDRPVTGITATASANNGLFCVTATARPQSIVPISYSQVGCSVIAKIDPSFTSSPTFPVGSKVENGSCERQGYCYQLNLVFVDGTVSPISGPLHL